MLDQHTTANSIVDAIFSTTVFFAEKMAACFTDRSLRPLFTPDSDGQALAKEYTFVTTGWPAVLAGNAEKVLKITDREYELRLNKLADRLRQTLLCLKGYDKKYITDQLNRLAIIQNEYVTHKVASGLRKAPFAIECHGLSSQGKTTFASQLVDCMLTSAGLPTEQKYRASHNASDKFWSNWTTDKLVLTIDDFANEKIDMMDTSPGRVIIDACNNNPYYANKADIDSKGKSFVEPEIVVITTNKKDLCAYQLSNCPYSIQRRPHLVIEVKARPEFQYEGGYGNQGIDSAKVREAKKPDSPCDDIWSLRVERAVQPKNLADVATYSYLSDSEGELKDVSFGRVALYVCKRYLAHREEQSSLMNDMQSRSKGVEVCDYQGCRMPKCFCKEHKGLHEIDLDEKQIGLERSYVYQKLQGIFLSPDRLIDRAQSMISSSIDRTASQAYDVATYSTFMTARYFYRWFDWLKFVPTPAIESSIGKKILLGMHGRKGARSFIRGMIWSGVTSFSMIGASMIHQTFYGLPSQMCRPGMAINPYSIFQVSIGASWFIFNGLRYKYIERRLWNEITSRNCIHPVLTRVRDATLTNAFKSSAILFAIYLCAKAYRGFQPQTFLQPSTAAEIAMRDKAESDWAPITKRKLDIAECSKTATHDQLINVVQKNLYYATLHSRGHRYMVNLLFVRTGVVLLPKHYFEHGDELHLEVRHEEPQALGGVHSVYISKTRSVFHPQSDLAVCFVATGKPQRDITKWLPTEIHGSHEIYMQWRAKSGNILDAKGLSRAMTVSHGISFYGGRYENLTMNTFKGLCGAILTTGQGGSFIYGLHVGGAPDKPRGCCVFIPREFIEQACDQLAKMPGVVLVGNASEFKKQTMGVNIAFDKEAPTKSCVRFLPKRSQIQYYGHSGMSTTSYTSVKVTPISEFVMDRMGIPNVYCAPKMRPEWFGWQKCLENMSDPGRDLPVDLVHRATLDYVRPLVEIYGSQLWRATKPLDYYDNVCGIPGKKFIDPIKLDTAVGFPLKGTKRDHVIEMVPTEEHPNLHRFNDTINDEIDRVEDLYKQGLRGNTIAKACKKDEVLTKTKCRIFYGNPISLTFLIRKYYLPLIRVLQMNPLISECAVGINAHGPDWNEFQEHALTFGRDRIIGGDYSKYDQKLPAQLIIASFWVLIECAKQCQYTEEDLRVMRAMVSDIVYAYITFDGSLISLTEGGHISGNSLTVIVNGICGSLNVRCAFFERLEAESFRDHVKLMTYGDDNIGSSSPESSFTIKMISEFLGRYGQVYTMPDKETEVSNYLPYEDFEFLKRKNVFCPKRSVYTGALIEKSIFKMLHCYMRPKKCELSPEMACASNIDTAMREWFHHGEDVYNARQQELLLVAQDAGILHLTTQLSLSYDECICEWSEKYKNTSSPLDHGDSKDIVEESYGYMDTNCNSVCVLH